MKKISAIIASIVLGVGALAGCKGTSASKQNSIPGVEGDNGEQVTITVAGPWSDCTAVEKSAAAFNTLYPNCHIVYEYLQDFDKTLPVRLDGEEKVDMYLTNNIQSGSELIPYTLELSSLGDKLDLSQAFEGLIDNFKLQTSDVDQSGLIYAIPLGADVRGMLVNKTILDSARVSVPTNREELLHACQVLKEKGYIALQNNPGSFGSAFLYPYICNLIANAGNYQQTYDLVNRADAATVNILEQPMQLLYDVVENDYYNYKNSETELNLFKDMTNEGVARSFLNISEKNGSYEKVDDIGLVPFMPFTMSTIGVVEKMKEDYHSNIEYQFILSPVGEDGGFAYLSPGRGIAVNKSSDNINWCIAFLNYLMQPENNISFADDMGYVPNVSNAMDILTKQFNIPKSHISQLGQVTFDYSFYDVINNTLVEISKGNNPKYMDQDENGSTVMYPFSYYMNKFAQRLAEVQK